MTNAELAVRHFELWGSSSQTAIDGEKIADITIPISYCTIEARNEAIENAPVERASGYYMRHIFNAGAKDGAYYFTPGKAYDAFSSVLTPFLWGGVLTYNGPSKSGYFALLLDKDPYLSDPETLSNYLHLTYVGRISSYGYVAALNNGQITTNVSRIDYDTGTLSAGGPVVNLFCRFNYNPYYKNPEGHLSHLFLDETAQKLAFDSIYVALFSMPGYHGPVISWGSYASTPAGAAAYNTDNIHAKWILGATGRDHIPIYLYLFGDKTGKIYSVQDGLKFEVLGGISQQSFETYGVTNLPTIDFFNSMEYPKIFRYTNYLESALPMSAAVDAIPKNNAIECIVDLAQAVTLISITAQYSGDVRVSWSYDNGGTWTEPRPMAEFLQVPMSQIWRGMGDDKKIRFRLALESSGAELRQFLVRWGRETDGA